MSETQFRILIATLFNIADKIRGTAYEGENRENGHTWSFDTLEESLEVADAMIAAAVPRTE